jgi:hypothetical protein
MGVCDLHTADLVSHKSEWSSNPSLCKVALKVGPVERTVGIAPVVLIERFLDSRADSVVVDHIEITTRAGLELEFVVGREVRIVFDLQTVSVAHLRVRSFLVAAMTRSSTAEDMRVSVCS